MEKLHGEMDALEFPPGDWQITRLGGATAQYDGIEFVSNPARRNIAAYCGLGDELDTFRSHEIDAALHNILVQLHVRNTIHQQAADAIRPLVHSDSVARAIELCCASEPGRAGTDDRNFFTGSFLRQVGRYPSLGKPVVDYRA